MNHHPGPQKTLLCCWFMDRVDCSDAFKKPEISEWGPVMSQECQDGIELDLKKVRFKSWLSHETFRMTLDQTFFQPLLAHQVVVRIELSPFNVLPHQVVVRTIGGRDYFHRPEEWC